MTAVEAFFKDMWEIHATGGNVPETSYYSALSNLLNEIGKGLKPRVRCVPTLQNTGGGNPDYGLYSANQFQKGQDKPLAGQHPERGVIEAKPLKDDSWVRAEGKQVSKYWGHYGQVLVTNFREFVFVGQNEDGQAVRLEPYSIATNEAAFWALAGQPRKAADAHGERLVEYLKRVMLNAAPLWEPEVLAWYLASYAREAKARIEEKANLPGLESLRKGLEEALGIKFGGEDGEHFFRATLIQTLFYGIFSSWVLWARNDGRHKDKKFNWHEAVWNLHVPMIAGLFSQIATPQKLKPLRIDEVLDWVGTVLNRVDKRKFFEKFEEEHAVQYFYEPFLKAYDPELRKELGVWYTPPEIVKYQVARVDTVLREELDIEDGLADPNVYVLDPCCGTGAYLVETLKKIHETLKQKGDDALTAQSLKKAAIGRIFGFEILPAPFVVSHLQLGLLLRQLGAGLSDVRNERAGVYLTNALTGWEPPKTPKDKLPYPEMQEERDAAEHVKREVPILVILGNPPYNAFAGTSPEEEEGLVEAYKENLNKPVKVGGWGIKKFNLDDLYVRFFRIAEKRIVKGGKGIVCYISNFSYLSDPSFVVMRERFLKEFDKLWFDCMNGDSRETGKLTPEGKPDPSVFSTEQTPVGIRVGTAICTLVRKQKRAKEAKVSFRNIWGTEKKTKLLESLRAKNFDKQYETVEPDKSNRNSFKPSEIAGKYNEWVKLDELCEMQYLQGMDEDRGFDLISIEKDVLERRMTQYFDKSCDWDSLKTICKGLTRVGGFEARNKVLISEKFDIERIKRYHLRPLDCRWCYYSTARPLWNRPRPELWNQYQGRHGFLISRAAGVAQPEGVPFLFVRDLIARDAIRGHAVAFPLIINESQGSKENKLFETDETKKHGRPNLSEMCRNYLNKIGVHASDIESDLIWMHVLAIGYSPKYLSENADGIRQDWPRVPLPNTRKLLEVSAEMGKRVAGLLDTESKVRGVDSGAIWPELKMIGVPAKVGGGNIHPDDGELDLTAGWGHAGKDGVTMPGKGKIVEREYSKEEVEAIEAGAERIGLSKAEAMGLLGRRTLDVYLNETAYWKNVPVGVWEYYIGGYQVVKKWLSYREKELLGRGLGHEEALYVRDMCRRIAAICLMGKGLDENYSAVKGACWEWAKQVVDKGRGIGQ